MKNRTISEIKKEQMESILDHYKDALELLDAYDHKTLVRPEGTHYDGYESVEEAAVNMLYDMVKNSDSQDCEKSLAAIKFLQFLDWNNVLYLDNKERISSIALASIILMIEKSKEEDKEMIIRLVLNCLQ